VNKMWKLKKILSIMVILIVIYFNISVDFTALFNDTEQNRHFVQMGAEKAYGLSTLTYDFNTNSDLAAFLNANPSAPAPYIDSGNLMLRIDNTDVLPGYLLYFQNASVTSVSMSRKNDLDPYSPYSPNMYERVFTMLYDTSGNHLATLTHTPIANPRGPYSSLPYGNENLINTLDAGGYIHIISDGTYTKTASTGYISAYHEENFTFDGSVGTLTYTLGTSTGSVTSDSLKGKALGYMYTLYYKWFGYSYGRYLYTDYIYVSSSMPPTFSINSPSQNSIFSEIGTAFIPQISVSDTDNDTLTCSYYIDSEATRRDTKTIPNTSTTQTVTFNALNMSTLTEGNHTIKYEVSDGKAAPVTSTVTFWVDKTPPVLGTVIVTSDINNITVSGSASDSLSNLHSTPFKYKIDSTESGWTNLTTYPQTPLNNLSPNTKYNVVFTARDANENAASTQQSIYTKAQVPILSVGNASSYMLDVSTSTADRNPAATEYQIIVNGTQYVTPEGKLTSSPVWTTLDNKKKTVKDLTPSAIYTFQMKARNAVNIESASSAAATGTTLVAPPGSPANITARATYNSITLSWDPVAGATKYEVLVNDVTTVNNNLLTSYTHSGLGANTQHRYKVRANIGTVAGAWSAPITKNTLTNAPQTPLNVKAAANNTSVIVTWDPAPGATTYQIKVDGDNSNTFSGTNYVHSGLTPGTQHSYQVRSLNSGGESAWSEELMVTALTDKPVIPANLNATPGKTQIALSWNGIIGETYEVEADGVIHNISSTPSFTHKDLIPGTEHTYRVRSNRSGILSNWCAALTVSTSANVFGVPGNFIVDASDNMVEMSWDFVTEATSYELEVDGSIIDNDTSLNCIHLGLTPGSQHVYKVRAKKDTQTSDWSKAVTVTTFILPTPENFSAVTSQTAITLNWDTVADAAGYDLEMDGAVAKDITDTFHTFPGLISGSQHVFRVRAVNQSGLSAWSTKLTKSTQLSNFEKTELSAISRKNSIIVMWDEIAGAASYDVSVDGITQSGITGLKYIHNSLTPGSIHIYKVKAVRGQEVHDWSDELSVKTISLSPDVPTNIEASSTTDKILITWDKVANAAEYVIEVDGQAVSVGSGTSYMHSGLLPDSQHTYKIMSKSALNECSAWSTPVTLKTKNSTRSYTVDCEQEDTFNFIFTASNLKDPSQYTFTITYDAAQLEAVDLCASTSRLDTGAGNVTGSDVNIVLTSPGTIVFKIIKPEIEGQMWSGTVNSIKFKSKINGKPVVQYTIN
jgi:hypothetical protein